MRENGKRSQVILGLERPPVGDDAELVWDGISDLVLDRPFVFQLLSHEQLLEPIREASWVRVR